MRKSFVVLLLASAIEGCASQASGPERQSGIEYQTPEEALIALRQKPDVQISEDGHGWTIISDKTTLSMWSFSPPTHPAHPTVVKHYLVNEGGGRAQLKMGVICKATKEACVAMVREFQAATTRTLDQMKGSRP